MAPFDRLDRDTDPVLSPGPGPTEILGRHVILELMDAQHLDHEEHMRVSLRDAAAAARATLVHLHVHRFAPQGVSGVAVLAESHISAHTWPERGYGAFDIYTCGTCDPEAGARSLAASFEAGRTRMRVLERGIHGASR